MTRDNPARKSGRSLLHSGDRPALVVLAARVRKARRPGTCPRCRTAIYLGQLVGRVDGRWLHALCIAGRKPPMIGWHSGQ